MITCDRSEAKDQSVQNMIPVFTGILKKPSGGVFIFMEAESHSVF